VKRKNKPNIWIKKNEQNLEMLVNFCSWGGIYIKPPKFHPSKMMMNKGVFFIIGGVGEM
jgi:hypothetical protein